MVGFGANLQPGQILAISSEPGKEALARAIAESAYERGALFVDLSVFDVHFKRARARHADPQTLPFIPPWLGDRARALGEHRCAQVALTGPVVPQIMNGIDPDLLGRDTLPSLPESMQVIDDRSTNWTAVPGPTPEWARLVYPDLESEAALDRLWSDVAHICRIDEPDPIQAWNERLDTLLAVAVKLDDLALDALRFHGPGTDLTIGLLPSSGWCAARFETVDGIVHAPNIPTEEVFTTPDPERVNGHVTATKPLFTSGMAVKGLEVHFEGGRAVSIAAEEGAEVLRGLSQHDPGAARLGEVALVDRESRIGPLGTVFYDTLIDENASSHIALGQGYDHGVRAEEDRARVNTSDVHVDFMIGGDAVAVTGVQRDGREISLLRDGRWQF
ncbi:MAG: aminopeptidase [Candidatus Dormibacteraeota bacterium]|nr:aminopeptidase [Candidatus Dormibacteraeota bacterium]